MSDTREDLPDQADGYNAGYAEQLFERRLRDRGHVPPSLARLMGDGAPVGTRGVPEEVAPPGAAAALPRRPAVEEPPAPARDAELLYGVAAGAGALVEAYRDHGHLGAQLDPLGSPPPGHPVLDPAFYGLDEEDLAEVPAGAVGLERLGETVADVVERLHEIYCGSIGYELDHVDDPEERAWLIEYIESGRHRRQLDRDEARALLERLSEVEGMERFLHRAYLGKKRFSIEGVDMMVPMLDEILERAAEAGVREAVLGMAHRGRLNVLAHVIGRPYRSIVAEFEGEHEAGVGTMIPDGGAGDVKYHLGAGGVVETEAGALDVYLAPNPSHLEHVNPVVQGMARAVRDLRARGERTGAAEEDGRPADAEDGKPVLPVLIHGDAAFMGQGVVAETLNLCRLEGYETDGTIHIIANNQLGFTSEPHELRSTRYASDLALGFRVPVVHVNADDPEACLAAARLACDYRRAFGHDMVIDLVGYRRHGHNEGDEPAYTQPALYRTIDDHPTVRTLWKERLAERGHVDDEEASAMDDRVAERLDRARSRVTGGEGIDEADEHVGVRDTLKTGLTELDDDGDYETGVEAETLRRLHTKMLSWPEDLQVFDKLARQMEKRRASLEEGQPLDWARAEMLAFASLVTEGVGVRLAGEDSVRGTFSQRHLDLRDVNGNGSHMPLRHLSGASAPFEAWNSPLSEVAGLGFEYGYSAIATEDLVLWEAQFGDFVNVAQAIVDQFVVAGRSKWGQESRVTLLLPHGYEGQGPEHSSARLERFLQLGARGNIRVVYPTTPAQYFHLLRLQALREARRPLVVMTPKSLLRHPEARSPLKELADGRFRPVLPDPEAGEGSEVERVVLCTGKVYYDLAGSDHRAEAPATAVVRLERLYPFPERELSAVLEAFSSAREWLWVQEEPENMGAWTHVRPRLRGLGPLPESGPRYVGRPAMASPAEGYASEHEAGQARILREAFRGERGSDA